MKALQMTYSLPRYAVSKVLGTLSPRVFTSPLAMLQLRNVAEPTLPNEHWVRVKVHYGGICGSDLHTIYLESSPYLQPFVSFPFTLGHEAVGTVAETGTAVSNIRVGDRVVVDPLLPCATRSIPQPCRFCQAGDYSLCENFDKGDLPPGLSIGHCRATGGSWSASFVAHKTQVFSVPDQVSDENAIFADPLSCAIHAVCRHPPLAGSRVLILGMGTMGLCILAAVRALVKAAHVVAVCRYAFQADLARRFGADHIIQARGEDYLQEVADILGARLHRPLLSKPVIIGGADVVYECVGSARSVDAALRLARAGGTVVLVGLASKPAGVDWTPIWLNELTLWGSFWASTERGSSVPVRSFQLALELMAQGKADLSPLVTHRFRLEDYQAAFATLRHKGKSRAVKAVFDFGRA